MQIHQKLKILFNTLCLTCYITENFAKVSSDGISFFNYFVTLSSQVKVYICDITNFVYFLIIKKCSNYIF